jgi:hypothetical protein
MIYRGSQVTAEADENGNLTLGYTWGIGADDLVAVHVYSGNNDYYVAKDQVGSVRGCVAQHPSIPGSSSAHAEVNSNSFQYLDCTSFRLTRAARA